jgi:hypothetical protein
MFFVLKFELILIIGSNTVLTEGVRKVYRGRRVGQGWSRQCGILNISQPSRPPRPLTGIDLLLPFYIVMRPSNHTATAHFADTIKKKRQDLTGVILRSVSRRDYLLQATISSNTWMCV